MVKKIGNTMERCNLHHHRLVNSVVKAIPVLMKKNNIAAAGESKKKKKKSAFLGLKKKNDDHQSRCYIHHRLVYAAVKAANSENVSDCFDILRYLKNMKLSVKEIFHSSEAIHVLESLIYHKNPKISTEVQVVFDSWRNTLHSGGRRRDDSKSKTTSCNKPLPILMMKKKNIAAAVIKKSDHKLIRPTRLQMKKESLPKKNTAEMLELFQIAKKSVDIANAKGILWAKEETCLCFETLSLLISYPISSTAKETPMLMEKLHRLTQHKDRKICNSASSLHQHWTQSIRDQQQP